MIVEIPDDNSIVKWKTNDKDDWTSAEISELIKAYEGRPKGEWTRHDEWRGGEYIGGFYHVNCPCIELGTALYSKWEYNFCPNCGADMRKTDPVISAIKENNAKYDERPNIDFSGTSYALGGGVE